MAPIRKNVHFLLAATISFMLAIVHTWWGVTGAIREIRPLSATARLSFVASWHSAGATLLVGGILLVHDALRGRASVLVPTVVAAIYAANFAVFLVTVVGWFPAVLAQTFVQVILFAAMLTFIVAGILERRRVAT